MTALSDLDRLGSSGGDKLPGFAFVRIGDGVKGTVLRSAIVDVPTDFGPRTKLVVELEVIAAKGGIRVVDTDGIVTGVTDYQAGDKVAVWLPKGYGIGAVADAVKAAGQTVLAEGGVLSVKLAERKDTGKAKPANVYEASYTPPVGGTELDAF